jgi:hypothetical protein
MNYIKYGRSLFASSIFWAITSSGTGTVDIQVPFDMLHKGNTYTAEVEIDEASIYMLTTDFYSNALFNKDLDLKANEYLQNLAGSFTKRLVGGELRQLSYGIELPLSVEMVSLDKNNPKYEVYLVPKREEENTISGGRCLGGYFCISRRITNFKLTPGRYKLTVTVLDDIPALGDVKTGLSFYSKNY